MPDHDTHPDHDARHDPALEGTLSVLDRLADADRAEPDEGFEARLAASTRPGVVASLDGRRTGPAARWWWAVPIAAAASLTLLLLPSHAPTPDPEPAAMTLASVESDLEAFLFIDELAESSASVADLLGDTDQSTPADELIFDLLTNEGSTL